MNLNQLAEDIATACDVRAKVVVAVQKETFRQLRVALEKGERVRVPEFGIFTVKEIPADDGQPAKKVFRFREKTGQSKAAERKEGKTKQEGKNRKRRHNAGQSENTDVGSVTELTSAE